MSKLSEEAKRMLAKLDELCPTDDGQDKPLDLAQNIIWEVADCRKPKCDDCLKMVLAAFLVMAELALRDGDGTVRPGAGPWRAA